MPRQAQANVPAICVDQQSQMVANANSRPPRNTSIPGTTPAAAAMTRSRMGHVCATGWGFATKSVLRYSSQPMRSSSMAKSSYQAVKPGAAVW